MVLLPVRMEHQHLVITLKSKSGPTSDEAAGVDEDAALDTRSLGQLVIAETAPDLRKSLAALEALGRDGDGLDAPLAARLVWINHVYGLLVLGDGEVAFELEEMLLRHALETYKRWRAYIPSRERKPQRG